MPYRSIAVERFQKLNDGQLDSASRDARSPPATAKEEGCIRQALKILLERIPLFCRLLGQQMPVPGGMDVGSFWPALRELGSTGETLLRLARDSKTSLLRCYRSLLIHWEREKVHARLV